MDDLISQLRSTQNAHDESVDSSPQSPPVPERDSESSEHSVQDPTSSQGQPFFHLMKLDFNLLRQVRTETQTTLTAADIRRTKKHRAGCFAAIVKHLDRFSRDVACLELVDESGSILASCLLGSADSLGIQTGSILILSGCALWKPDNHLNIVAANILKTI